MGVCLIIRTSGGTDTSGATATAARVLSGYTCYVNDVKITGTMTNQGTKTASLNAGGSYTIPAGYHSGSGKVTANALSGQTSGTATAARILSGRTAWVNGSKLTGTMTNRGAISQKLAANGSYTVPAGWHNGSGKVTQSLTTQGAKNVTPKTTNQTACAASRWTTGSIVILGSSDLKAVNIKDGVKIFGVTGTWTGPVDSNLALDNYFKPSVENKSKIYRSANYRNNSVLEFSGAGVDYVELANKLAEYGYVRLWIEANFNYYTEKIVDSSNRVMARFLLKTLTGSDHPDESNVNKYTRFNTAGSVQNVWVFLNYKFRNTAHNPTMYAVKPYVFVWFANRTGTWDQWADTDWFQMLKWACWFSKS